MAGVEFDNAIELLIQRNARNRPYNILSRRIPKDFSFPPCDTPVKKQIPHICGANSNKTRQNVKNTE